MLNANRVEAARLAELEQIAMNINNLKRASGTREGLAATC
jgi:hypothetical protein